VPILFVLVLIETFVNVFVPNAHPPAAVITEIAVGELHSIVAKLSDDRTVVPKARSKDRLKIVGIIITDISPKISLSAPTVQADGDKRFVIPKYNSRSGRR
jgi:hypothetical protein